MLILASWWPARWSYAKLLYMQATQSGTIKKCSQGWPSSGPALLGARRASQMPDRKLMLLLRVPEHQATLAWIIDRAAAWSGYIKLMEDGKHELSRKARKEEPGLGYCNMSLTEELFSFFFFFFFVAAPCSSGSRNNCITSLGRNRGNVCFAGHVKTIWNDWCDLWESARWFSEAALKCEPSPFVWFLHELQILCFIPAYLRPKMLRGMCI